MIVTSEIKSKGFLELLEQAGKFAATREGLDPARIEVSLSFVSAKEIRELNAKYRGIDESTDVLSFPMFESIKSLPYSSLGPESCDAPVLLGDIVICREIAGIQAAEIGQSMERELLYLFVHSMFHLLGYDHENEDDKLNMRAVEEEVLREIGEAN